MAMNERSIADVLQDIIRNIQEIVRSEVRLAKTEAREEIGKVRAAGTMLGVGAVCGIFGTFFLLLAAVYALSRVMPNWGAALTVALVLSVIAAVMLSAGLKQFRQVHPTPNKTIESVKENVEWAKQQVK